jgi:acyl carrier protein
MPFIFVGCEKKRTRQEINTKSDKNTIQTQHYTQESFTQVKKMVNEVLEIATDSIKPETKLTDLGLRIQTDDIDYMELVMHIEAEFEIEITDEDAKKFTTIGEICDYIDKTVEK